MSFIRVQGLKSLQGKIKIQGSKNAVLPIMAAALLHKGMVVIKNVPRIQDVFCMLEILKALGCSYQFEGHELTLDTRDLCSYKVPEREGRQMRSSVMLLGPLLGRLHRAWTCYPGGCVIGKRPIDLHLSALEKLGAKIDPREDGIFVTGERLSGADVHLLFPSVGATENVLMAGAAAKGTTRIFGAAKEPEIQTLCDFLNRLGAKVCGIGTDVLTVEGKRTFQDVEFTVPGDRIVAGTYLGAVTAAGGEICLTGVPVSHMEGTLDVVRETGCQVEAWGREIRASMRGRPLPVQVCTGPYPEFSTDLQSVMLSVAAVAEGNSRIQENIFEERFATGKELQKLGTQIIIKDRTAFVTGRYPLKGGEVYALDLRGGAALTVAALAAEGESRIHGCFYICRGYEDICKDLSAVGARVSMEEE